MLFYHVLYTNLTVLALKLYSNWLRTDLPCFPPKGLSDCAVITGFTVVFVVIYPVQMYVTEVYIANVQSMFVFMSFKYCYGCLHIVLLPFIILIMKKDIRRAAISTYVKNNTDDGEITFEQLQEHVGIGVNPGM